MRSPLRSFALAACGLMAFHGAAAGQGNSPVIQSLAPTSTAAGSGAFSLIVNGSNFRADAVVEWNSQSRPTTYVNGGQLQANISASDVAQSGTAQVTVLVPIGQGRRSDPASFTISSPPPTIASLSPSSAAAGGEPITLVINGANFLTGAEVHWNDNRRATSGSASRLTTSLTAADLSRPGTAQVRVVNPGSGSSASDPRPFSVTHQTPRILRFEPDRVTEGHGDFKLTIVGSNFIRSASTVLWNGAARETRFISPTQVVASIRAADVASSGNASVTVRTETGGSARASTTSTYGVHSAPVIISVPTLVVPSISSFQIAEGRPYVSVGTSVRLRATATGEADKFRTADRRQGCATDLAAVAWRNWYPSRPPQWSSSSTGTKRVCFQVGRTNGSNVLASAPAEDAIEVVEALRITAWVGVTSGFAGLIPTKTTDLVSPWKFAVGLAVREGDWIDAAGVRTTQLGRNGEHGSLTDAGLLRLVGGMGGDPRDRTCPSGEVINAVRGRRGSVIESLQVGCRPWNRDRGAYGSQRWLPRFGGPGGNSDYELVCPTPLAAWTVQFSPVSLGFGTYVGGLRIVCIVPPGL